MKDSRINWLWSLKNRGILPTWNWIQNETSYWNPPPLYSPLSLLSFALFLSPPLLSNLLSSLTDTYTCNSQPDPSESKLRFELPASGQISRRNPEWRHVFAPLPIFPVSPPPRVVCIFESESFPLRHYLKAPHQKATLGVLTCSESAVVMFLIPDESRLNG